MAETYYQTRWKQQMRDRDKVTNGERFLFDLQALGLYSMIQTADASYNRSRIFENPANAQFLRRLEAKCRYIHILCRISAPQHYMETRSGNDTVVAVPLGDTTTVIATPKYFDFAELGKHGSKGVTPVVVSDALIYDRERDACNVRLYTPMEDCYMIPHLPDLN